MIAELNITNESPSDRREREAEENRAKRAEFDRRLAALRGAK